jgi:chemotaxis protein MotB
LQDAVWLYSYADLVTQLLLFAILMLVAAFATQAAAPASAARRERDPLAALVDDLQRVVARTDLARLVAVDRGADRVVIRIKSVLLFPEGQAALTPRARRVLDEVAAVLRPIPNALRVEGHTDDVPIASAQFPSNWELSTARAISVVRELEPRGIAATRLAAGGYGEHHPLVPNDTAEQRALNRRVEIVVLGRSGR